MTENILSLIIGGGIAIVSGGLSQFLNNYFKSKNEKEKYIFEKLEDIIEIVSSLEESFQTDIAGILMVSNPADREKSQNFTFQENKLECLVKIYHKDLSEPFSDLKSAMNTYHEKKRNIVNLIRTTKTNEERLNNEVEGLKSDFGNLSNKMNQFIRELTVYGSKKMN